MNDPAYPTMVPYTIRRADIDSVQHSIILLGGGYYRIDGARKSQSSIVGAGGVIKLASSDTDALATINFPNPSSWAPENLGYENFWMLISYYPLERTPGLSGSPCRGEAGRRRAGDNL